MIANMQNNLMGGVRVLELVDLPGEELEQAQAKTDFDTTENVITCKQLRLDMMKNLF